MSTIASARARVFTDRVLDDPGDPHMCPPGAHRHTVEFFTAKKFFGLNPADVHFFQQGSMPAVDRNSGKLLLSARGELSTSPDGHGGILSALKRAGLLEEMRNRGVEYLFYHQVDNPLARVCDPAFLGYHAARGSEVSTNWANYYNAGLKGRFMETKIDDDHLLRAANYPVLKLVDGLAKLVDTRSCLQAKQDSAPKAQSSVRSSSRWVARGYLGSEAGNRWNPAVRAAGFRVRQPFDR